MAKAERPNLEVDFLRRSWYINELYDAVLGRPSERLAAFSATVIDPKVIDGGVNGVATLVRKSGALHPAQPDRLRAQLRTGHRARHRSGARLHADPVVVDLMATSHFPFLTVLVLVPAIGAAVVALVPTRSVSRHFHEGLGVLVALFTLVLAAVIAGQFKVGNGGYQLVSDHIWAERAGHPLVAGHRRDLPVPGGDDRPPLPAGPARGPGQAGSPLLRGLGAAAGGGLPGQLRLPRPGVVLPLLRADPGPGLLHHRRMGLCPPGLCRHQVLHLHLRRLGLPAGGHPGRRVHPPVPDRSADLRAPRPRAHPSLGDRGRAPLPRLHRRVRGQGADLPLPHLVAGRLRRGAHRRRGPAGRGDGQARDLRDHPIRSQPLPAGHPHPGALVVDVGRDRHPLRRGGCLRPAAT